MRYATAEAFRAALEDRLKNAENETVGISRLRKRVVFERLLARLTAQAEGEWVLKGGFALELRLDELSRSTKDIDIDWSLGEEDATERLLDAADLDVGDMFEFRLQRADQTKSSTAAGNAGRQQRCWTDASSSVSSSTLRSRQNRSSSLTRCCPLGYSHSPALIRWR